MSCMIATAVNILVADAMLSFVSVRFGIAYALLAKP